MFSLNGNPWQWCPGNDTLHTLQRAHTGRGWESTVSLLWEERVRLMSLLWHGMSTNLCICSQPEAERAHATTCSGFLGLHQLPISLVQHMRSKKSQFRLSSLNYCNDSCKACHYFWTYSQMGMIWQLLVSRSFCAVGMLKITLGRQKEYS